MKVKHILGLTLVACIALGATACGNTAANSGKAAETKTAEASEKTEQAMEYKWDFVKKTTGLEDYKKECDQQGAIEELEYETPDYVTGSDKKFTKHLWVYTPYGYDENKQYDILYLMHGGGESEIYWIAGERWGPTTRNVIDNMIKNGDCEPFIIVTPTFYPPEGDFENPEGAQKLTEVFAEELRNEVVPLVESKYLTYADKDVSDAGLIASRDHRAFAGFSMGSMTSIHSALMKNVDIFSWVGSFSGAKTEVADFQAALESEEYKDYDIKFWYNGNGKADIAHDEHDEFAHGVLEAMPERFTDGENFAWVDLRDGSHAYQAWLVHLYNCMLVFFK